MSAPAAAAAAAAGPLPSWEQIEREAGEFLNRHYLDTDSDALVDSISELVGYRPDDLEEPTPPYIRALAHEYNHRPFQAFVHIRYPHVDQTTPEFHWSVLVAWFKRNRDDRRANELAGALASGGAAAIRYIVDSGRLDTRPAVERLIRVLGPIIGKSSMFGYRGHGTVFSTHPAMRALEQLVRALANPRAAIATSRVYDALSARSGGPHLAQYAATFAHPSIGPHRAAVEGDAYFGGDENPGFFIVPRVDRREPLHIRTHFGELQRIREELVMALQANPEQLLARVTAAKRHLDGLVESVEKRHHHE